MILYLTSDIHLEFLDAKRISTITKRYKKKLDNHLQGLNILICAGDICSVIHSNFSLYFEQVSKLFDYTFFVPGNHEYYGTTMNIAVDIMLKDIPINVIVLDNKTFDIPDTNIRIIGSTLWSDLCYQKENDEFAFYTAERQINDFHTIFDFTPKKYQELHLHNRKFLEDQINNDDQKDLIVITHHIPSYDLVHPKFKHCSNQCFASNLNDLIRPPVKMWFYAHTHQENDTTINKLRMVCNPLGYINENKTFELLKTIEFD